MKANAYDVNEAEALPLPVYEQLAGATSVQRRALVLQLIEEQPEGRLSLPRHEGKRATLDDIDLRPSELRARRHTTIEAPAWWSDDLDAPTLREADLRGASLRGANLEGVDLRGANLQDASLGNANLRGARLGNADLRGADLADADFEGANLGETRLQGALLEQANLRGASLRFAELQHSALDGADLQGADLWGVHLEGAFLEAANLQDTQLREAHLEGATLTNADLRRSDLRTACFEDADLTGVDLRGAEVAEASFRNAVLQRARLQAMVLTDCDVTHVHLSGAWLNKTRLDKDQLGGALGEERAGDYEQAAAGYLALEQNFEDLGDPDAARSAYLRRRRMQKRLARRRSAEAFRAQRWRTALTQLGEYVRLQFVEWLCDYGESIPRTLVSILVLYVIFTIIYGLTGSVVRASGAGAVVGLWPLSDLIDLMTFSLITMTAPEGPQVALHPANDIAHVFTSLQTLLTVVLAGLLGYVLGNRIHQR